MTLRSIRISNKLYKNIVESYKSFIRFHRNGREMILESWEPRGTKRYGRELQGWEDESKMDKVEGMSVQVSRLWDKLTQLMYGEKKLTPEQYAKVVASMRKEMDQLITRHGEDKVELAFGRGRDINLIPYYGHTPDWLDDAINAGKTNHELINKALKKINYGADMSNNNYKQDVRKGQRNLNR